MLTKQYFPAPHKNHNFAPAGVGKEKAEFAARIYVLEHIALGRQNRNCWAFATIRGNWYDSQLLALLRFYDLYKIVRLYLVIRGKWSVKLVSALFPHYRKRGRKKSCTEIATYIHNSNNNNKKSNERIFCSELKKKKQLCQSKRQ